MITSILRHEGSTGVHTHVKELEAFLDEAGTPSTTATPCSRTPLLERADFRGAPAT